MIQKGFSGFKRFLAVMETEPEIQDSPGCKATQRRPRTGFLRGCILPLQ